MAGEPIVDHVWQGDEDGHNCAACPDGSVWRCDRPAHINVTPKLTAAWRARLAAWQRKRRTTPIPNRRLG